MIYKKIKKSCQINITKPGTYVYFFSDLSDQIVFNIRSQYAWVYIFGLYIAKNKQQYNISTVQRHYSPNSYSDLLIKGVFDDESKFNYHGLIRIEKNARKSHSYQKNQNIILSDHIIINSKPYLEILNNDVYCSHGSSTGKINQDVLDYLYSRGLTKQLAIDIYTKGFIQEIFDKINRFRINRNK